MKKLKINWFELELAFNNASYDLNYYLDTETGDVLLVTQEASDLLADIYRELSDEENFKTFDLTSFSSQAALPDWQKAYILEAYRVNNDPVSRYLSIPEKSSNDAYNNYLSIAS